MSCPCCGGALKVGEGVELTSCPYCSALLEVSGQDGVRNVMFRNQLTRDEAIGGARAWWRSLYIARDLKRKAEIVEAFLIYAPFWKLHAMAAGWVCGQGNPDVGRSEEYIEKMVLSDDVWTAMACDPGDIGVGHLDNLSGEALPLEAGAVPTFEITRSRTDAIAQGCKAIEKWAAQSAGVSCVTFSRMQVIPGDLRVIFYPLWVVRYAYEGHMYFVTVDGVTGLAMSGRAPGSLIARSVVLAAGGAVGLMGIALCLWFTGTVVMLEANVAHGHSNALRLPIMVDVAAIPACVAILFIAYSYFRYGSEVTLGDVEGGYDLASMWKKLSLGYWLGNKNKEGHDEDNAS